MNSLSELKFEVMAANEDSSRFRSRCLARLERLEQMGNMALGPSRR